jgi:predicted metal-dependent peptidase
MNAEAKAKMTRARASLILDQPFFGTLALRLHMSESDQHKTMATDGRRLIYNPKWVNSLPIGEVKGVVAHEVMHVVYNHPGRRGAREPGRWNRACDYAINTTLIDAGFELPKGGCIDAQYKGMTADQIYNMLPPGDKDDDPDDLMDGEAEPLSPEEVRDWKVAVIQAASEAKKAGQLSNGLSRLIDDIVEPKADWRALLRQFVTERSNADYDWSRPNKRMLSLGFCLPSLYSERCGTIAVFKDISCSIDKETSAAFSPRSVRSARTSGPNTYSCCTSTPRFKKSRNLPTASSRNWTTSLAAVRTSGRPSSMSKSTTSARCAQST